MENEVKESQFQDILAEWEQHDADTLQKKANESSYKVFTASPYNYQLTNAELVALDKFTAYGQWFYGISTGVVLASIIFIIAMKWKSGAFYKILSTLLGIVGTFTGFSWQKLGTEAGKKQLVDEYLKNRTKVSEQ